MKSVRHNSLNLCEHLPVKFRHRVRHEIPPHDPVAELAMFGSALNDTSLVYGAE